jgi:bacterioferritin (cytochrome b1)
MARGVEECYAGALASVAAYTYRSLMTEQSDPALSRMMDEIREEKVEHFRLLGGLILALGAEPAVRTQIRVGGERRYRELGSHGERIQLLRDALAGERSTVDRMQTLMGRTEDRVVRSLLSYLISDGERWICSLEEMAR